MDYKDSIEATARYVRLALPLMSQLEIPITPVNYAVWYNYVSGINKELKETIDSLREGGETFSEELNEKLYRRFLADKEETAGAAGKPESSPGKHSGRSGESERARGRIRVHGFRVRR